jgi:hypothetical protein
MTNDDARDPVDDPVDADRRLCAAVDDCLRRGWTPADLIHVVRRHLAAGHVAVLAGLLLADGRRHRADGQRLHPRWLEQLASLEDLVDAGETRPGGFASRLGVEVRQLLERLPDLPQTIPAPGGIWTAASRGDARTDARLLERVRALLAKAESTSFEQEAEAFTAKAQELIARHALDEALLHAVDDVGEAAVRRIHLDDPYLDAKAMIVTAVGDVNRCRTVQTDVFGWVTVFGFEQDLDAVELLSTSLLAQATAAMVRHGPQRDGLGRSRTRSFRRAFLLGFGQRIAHRLERATEEQVAATEDVAGRLAPVLAARGEQVLAAQRAAFPNLTIRTTTASNPRGWAEGEAAAERARVDISPLRLPAR